MYDLMVNCARMQNFMMIRVSTFSNNAYEIQITKLTKSLILVLNFWDFETFWDLWRFLRVPTPKLILLWILEFSATLMMVSHNFLHHLSPYWRFPMPPGLEKASKPPLRISSFTEKYTIWHAKWFSRFDTSLSFRSFSVLDNAFLTFCHLVQQLQND